MVVLQNRRSESKSVNKIVVLSFFTKLFDSESLIVYLFVINIVLLWIEISFKNIRFTDKIIEKYKYRTPVYKSLVQRAALKCYVNNVNILNENVLVISFLLYV